MTTPVYKRLYRTYEGRILFGVCSGLGEYFQIDPTIVRILFLILALMAGPGIVLYILLAIFVPNEPTTPAGPDQSVPPSALN
jgi:phage shock protein C